MAIFSTYSVNNGNCVQDAQQPVLTILSKTLLHLLCFSSCHVFDLQQSHVIVPGAQVSHLLAEPAPAKPVLGPQEASMMIWALAVLHELNPTIWTALLDTIAAAPQESLDEVIHHKPNLS